MSHWVPLPVTKSAPGETAGVVGRVPQYRDSAATLSEELVAVEQIQPLCRTVRLGRLGHACVLVQSMLAKGYDLFDPVHIRPDGGRGRFVPPPIIESHPDGLILIDGHHRLYAARLLGVERVKVVLVSGNLPDPPADPLDWAGVRISTDLNTPREEKFHNLRPWLFRDIATFVDAES